MNEEKNEIIINPQVVQKRKKHFFKKILLHLLAIPFFVLAIYGFSQIIFIDSQILSIRKDARVYLEEDISKQGIYDLLTNKHSKVPPKIANYTLNHLNVNWRKVALKKAKAYAKKEEKYSKQQIFDRLSSPNYDHFTYEQAQYAVDHLNVDWNQVALEKAKSYMESDYGYSKETIFNRLSSRKEDHFTKEQAQYAVDKLDVDWNTVAHKRAKIYTSKDYRYSKQQIFDRLSSRKEDQFTKEQAQYAVNQLDVDWDTIAYEKATIYASKNYSYSKQQIFDFLSSGEKDNFTKEQAQYAIDHLQVDWNQVAFEKANMHASDNYSKAYLYQLLSSPRGDQFTKEQAQYAVNQLKTDWNQSALETAKIYAADYYSKKFIFQLLTSPEADQFTKEQAQYALDHLGDVDWKESAFLKAAQYNFQKLSESELISELTSEEDQFTKEEAQYAYHKLRKETALRRAGSSNEAKYTHPKYESIKKELATDEFEFTEEEINYAIQELRKEKALHVAKDLKKEGSSNDKIIKRLISNEFKFTKEQAQYAIDHLSDK